mgnify:CR=1 FL=1
MTQSQISVAIATYNGAQFLDAQLASILQQSLPVSEVVVSDDCSTDGSREVVSAWVERDPRVVLIESSENVGFIKNFERALRACRGELVALSDQDDLWMPEKMRLLTDALGKADLAVSDGIIVDQALNSTGRTIGERFGGGAEATRLDALLLSPRFPGHTMLFTRELLQKALPFPEGIAHDWWLSLVAAAEGGIAYSPELLVLHRQHGGNTLGTTERRRTSRSLIRRVREWPVILANSHRRRIERLDAIVEAAGAHPVSRMLIVQARRHRRFHRGFFDKRFSPYRGWFYFKTHRRSGRSLRDPFFWWRVFQAAVGFPGIE